ncbi:Cof-type HAD-IIB family hydrolase [Sporosarcina ureilytica]|uniref:Hydrolase n=1 Tax=Sporosarcina ureilytica TaxID=298596 RepID=A0A1D8JIR1_9BACL|nr:Cof-type HAD-IIB family hydrolase [Sporosarcina ureilytica]AOV08591.1 hypothetical protein BI350_14315 [Sporosarcina ureilytica]
MIRLIAIDMDGTLLSPDHTISEMNKQSIREAQAQGIEVVIATGRSYLEAYEPVHQEGLDLSYICINGAEVRDNTGNLITGTHLLEEDIHKVVSILELHEIDCQLFIDKTVYAKSIQVQIDTFIQLAEAANLTPNVEDIRKEIESRAEQGIVQIVNSFDPILEDHQREIYKILGTSFNRENLDVARAALNNIPSLAISSSGAGNLEITNVNAQKGIALTALARARDIPMEQVMAIGDNYNDLSMMERVGRSVAMGNAPKTIQAACDHITETNSNDGVSVAIQKVLQAQMSR